MEAKIVGRMIVLGTVLVLTGACSNPLTSSLGTPDFFKGSGTRWYTSTASGGKISGDNSPAHLLSGLACENAIGEAATANGDHIEIKKVEVAVVMDKDRIVSTRCRVEIRQGGKK